MILNALTSALNGRKIQEIAEFGGGDSCFYPAFRKKFKNANFTALDSSKNGVEGFKKKYLTHPLAPSAREGEVKSPILVDRDLKQGGVAPLNHKDCDSRESSEILPANFKSCVGLDNSRESNEVLPTFSKSRWVWATPINNNTSPSLAEGARGRVKSKNPKDSRDSSESQKIFQLTPQNDKVLDLRQSQKIPTQKAILCDLLHAKLSPKYDLVFSVGLIEHFDKNGTRRILEQHFNALKRGGIALITYPTPTLPYRAIRFCAEIFGVWAFPDERPLYFSEVDGVCAEFGELKSRKLNLFIGLSQEILIYQKY